MNEETIKKYAISAAYTFGSTFLTFLGAAIALGDVAWSKAAIAGLLVAAVRASIKAVLDQFVPARLGGRK